MGPTKLSATPGSAIRFLIGANFGAITKRLINPFSFFSLASGGCFDLLPAKADPFLLGGPATWALDCRIRRSSLVPSLSCVP
ncbi:hypothetical protein MUK42_33742 [Musa troglodytarum]|uniref:Uncharacterized protein n=1 Tax=Musa troglodytarum TaxID=320322 RepID=A0A9E7I3Y4_9LILI|nr:hypothetical protein MUK42_33742 [Musa troglodytarum]